MDRDEKVLKMAKGLAEYVKENGELREKIAQLEKENKILKDQVKRLLALTTYKGGM